MDPLRQAPKRVPRLLTASQARQLAELIDSPRSCEANALKWSPPLYALPGNLPRIAGPMPFDLPFGEGVARGSGLRRSFQMIAPPILVATPGSPSLASRAGARDVRRG